MKIIRFIICGVMLLAVKSVAAPGLADMPKLDNNADYGVIIKNLMTGKIVTAINADSLFMPASLTKSITSASLLSQLFTDKRFVTDIMLKGVSKDTTFVGDIIIKACGDPTIESKHFEKYNLCDSISAELAKRNIRSVHGQILFAYSPRIDQEVPAGWKNNDLVSTYGTAFHAFNYRDNIMAINLETGETNTPADSIKIIRIDGCGISKPRDAKVLKIGRNAKGTTAMPMIDPTDNFRSMLIRSMRVNGISYHPEARKTAGEVKLMYRHVSPSYSQINKSMMTRSDNLMAEGMLQTLAPGRGREAAIERELALWESRGLNIDGIVIEDGCGLSRNNRVTPRFLSDIYEWMACSDDAEEYVSYFPKAGIEGTMKRMLKGTHLEGRIATKTGSVNSVQCYGGFLLDADGNPTHTIVIMANNFRSDRSEIKKTISKFLIDIFPENEE